jgi:hypothetical protein
MRGWMQGSGKVQSRIICDVRDAATAHILAGEHLADDVGGGTSKLPGLLFKRFIVGHEGRTPADLMRQSIVAACGSGDIDLIGLDQVTLT